HRWLASGTQSSGVNNLGRNIAALLLMGDHQDQNNIPMVTGYDDLRGAGPLPARQFADAGMGAPGGFESGPVVGRDGESVAVGISIPKGAKRLVVTMWWPEPNMGDQGANAADIDMMLIPPPTHYPTVAYGDWSYDTKKRIVLGNKP